MPGVVRAVKSFVSNPVKAIDQALTSIDKGVLKPVGNAAGKLLNDVNKGILKPVVKAADQTLTAVDKGIIKPVVSTAERTATSIGKTMEAVAKNPLPVIETIGLTMMGVPAPLANAMVVGMNGGSMKDMATAALVSSVPQIGNSISSTLGVNAAVGNIIAKTGVQLAIGVPMEKAINNTLVSVAAQSTAPYISQQLKGVIESPAMVRALTNVAVTAETGILQGKSAEQIGQAMTMTAIYSAPSIVQEWNAKPAALPQLPTAPAPTQMNSNSGLSPFDPNSPSFVGPQLPNSAVTYAVEPPGVIESSPLDAMTITEPAEPTVDSQTSPLDNFDYSTLPQPDQSEPLEPYTPPVITDFKPDYSLSSGVTTGAGVDESTGTGLTAPTFPTSIPESTTYPYDFTPDYGLYDPATDPNSGLGLQMPESPAIKDMGGGQGLTANTTSPDGTTGTVGALGTTPEGASPILGDKDSFINNPDVTGQPVMASDPAYDDPLSWLKSSGGLGGMDLSTGEKYSSPLSSNVKGGITGDTLNAKVAQSYLKGIEPEAAPTSLQMAQLQQLYPTITPDLSKILLDRGMLLPSQNQAVNFGSSGNDMPDLNQTDANLLSAVDLANFGQPQFAKGGNVHLPPGHHPEFITGKTGHYAQGRGTGQSDDIPAVLYEGDYVMDADTVAALGDGSSKAGAGALEQFRRSIPVSNSVGGRQIPAKIADSEFVLPSGFVTALGGGSNKQGSKMLDAMREQIRIHKRSAPETKIPPKARSPLQYMREAMKG